MAELLTIDDVNALDDATFQATFGHVYEDTPALAVAAGRRRPYADRAALESAFADAAGDLDDDGVLALLRAHPQLSGDAPMTAASTDEQQSAGLTALDDRARDEIRAGNARYLDRFGFPFIIAVRGLGPADIVAALTERLGHTQAEERAAALEQVQRIARLRIEQLVKRERVSAQPSIDGERLVARLAELAAIGASSAGGTTREAYGPGDVEARSVVAGWMAEAGLHTEVDAAANLIGRRAGTGPAARWLVTGSHLDTVVGAGPLDGSYGVVAAVEVADAFRRAGSPLAHDLVVVAFANEEGARGTDGMAGSRALVGEVAAEELAAPDDDGILLSQRLADAGGDAASLDGARWDPASVAAFIELHVEQGPVLDSGGEHLGIVTGITGRQAVDIEIVGAPNHAGTTPMDLRADAATAMAEVVLAIEAMARTGVVRVATCGHLSISPNVRNVVPGHARVSAELRDHEPETLAAARPLVEEAVATIAARRGLHATVKWGQYVSPVAADAGVLAAIEAAASRSTRPWRALWSGAGHDAQIFARFVPTAMIFVPSIGGVSHAPSERSEPSHLVAGAQLLADTLLELDDRLRSGSRA